MMLLDKKEVSRLASNAAFGEPLVCNMYRGLLAEVLVQSVLSKEWRWCGKDWGGWDFEHDDGCRLEVKQSASLQTWSPGKISKCNFGTAGSKGFHTGDVWTELAGRKASIYVFAHHDGVDKATADHHDPLQWKFYTLPASELGPSQSTSLATLIETSRRVWTGLDLTRTGPCDLSGLNSAIELIRSTESVKRA